MIFFFSGVAFIFYLNRNELLTVKIVDGIGEFSFVNKSFFKREDRKVSIKQLVPSID